MAQPLDQGAADHDTVGDPGRGPGLFAGGKTEAQGDRQLRGLADAGDQLRRGIIHYCAATSINVSAVSAGAAKKGE